MLVRNNIRSFRFSDRVLKILEDFEGDNLNDKFNNLVLFCFDRLPELKKKSDFLDIQIRVKENDLAQLSRVFDVLRACESDIARLQMGFSDVLSDFERI